MELLFFYFTGALLALALAGLLTVLVGHWLDLADRLRELLKAAAFDVVQLQRSANQAQLDTATGQAKLECAQELAQLRLAEQRRKLLGEGER